MDKRVFFTFAFSISFITALFTQIDWKEELNDLNNYSFTRESISYKYNYRIGPDGRLITQTELNNKELEIQNTKGCVACHPNY